MVATVASTTTSTTTPDVEQLVVDGDEPFNLAYPTIGELPEMPDQVAGYVSVTDVQQSMVRVYGDDEFETVFEFPWQGNKCNYGFWVARWSSGSPDLLVSATNDIIYNEPDNSAVEESTVPPPAPAGVLGGFACTTPGFRGPTAALFDIRVEWQYFDRDYFEVDAEPPPATPGPPSTEPPTCPTYEYREYEPFSLCTQGPGVETLQRALVFFGYMNGSADGYFGPGTENAVRQVQRDYGVAADGVVGGQWYREFIEAYNLSR